jgi:hypothetical protein
MAFSRVSWRMNAYVIGGVVPGCFHGRHAGGMRLVLARILLSPVTSWRAARVVARSGGRTSFDVAWRQVRLATHPDELPYWQHGHRGPTKSPAPREVERD